MYAVRVIVHLAPCGKLHLVLMYFAYFAECLFSSYSGIPGIVDLSTKTPHVSIMLSYWDMHVLIFWIFVVTMETVQ